MEENREYCPTTAWRSADPQQFGIEPDNLLPFRQCAQEDQRIHSLLLIRSGYVVFEEYYQGWSVNSYHNVNSISKNVTSALVGIALREGMIDTLDRPFVTFFPEYAAPGKQEKREAIHLHHLLSMTSGFQIQGDIDLFLEQTASVENMLSLPIEHEPGEAFAYDDINIHLLSLILTRVTGMSTANFARDFLFKPLGIWRDELGQLYPWKNGTARADAPHPWGLWNEKDDALWSVDRRGYTIGPFGLQLTTREIAKLGYLYMYEGKWDGQQIIPADYVQASLRSYSITGARSGGSGYGYGWYLPPDWGAGTFLAIGFGGQFLACFPEYDLVFAMTAYPEVGKPAAHVPVVNRVLLPLIETLKK